MTGPLDHGDLLDRTLVLVLRSYGKLRAAVQYLRYEKGDADDFAPSPYVIRGGGRPRKTTDDPDPLDAPVPSITPAAPVVTAGSAATAPAIAKPVEHNASTAA